MIDTFGFESLNQPDFDNRLPGNSDTSCLTIQGINNPGWEVDIDTLLFLIYPACCGEIEIINDVSFPSSNFLSKFLAFIEFHLFLSRTSYR